VGGHVWYGALLVYLWTVEHCPRIVSWTICLSYLCVLGAFSRGVGGRERGREGVHFWVAKYLVGFMRRIRIR